MKKGTLLFIIILLTNSAFSYMPVFKDTMKVYPFDPVVVTGTRIEMSKKDLELDELRRNLDINLDDNKVKMLQQTVQNLTSEVRDLKKKNEELNKQMLEKPIESDFTRARFHGSSNLNNDLYR